MSSSIKVIDINQIEYKENDHVMLFPSDLRETILEILFDSSIKWNNPYDNENISESKKSEIKIRLKNYFRDVIGKKDVVFVEKHLPTLRCCFETVLGLLKYIYNDDDYSVTVEIDIDNLEQPLFEKVPNYWDSPHNYDLISLETKNSIVSLIENRLNYDLRRR